MKPRSSVAIYGSRVITVVFCLFSSIQLLAASEFENSLLEQELSRARSDPDNRTTIRVEQPIALVFDALLMRLAEYTDDIASVEFDNRSAEIPGTPGVGSQRITTMVDGDILVQRIVVFEPPLRFAYFTDMSVSTVRVPIEYSIGYYTFTEQAPGIVEATVSVAYKPSSRLTAFLVRMGFNRALVKDFEKAETYLNGL